MRKTKRTKRTTKPRREGLMPNEYHQGPVTVVAPFRLEEGGILRGERKYIVETWRKEGEWSVEIQWIETRGDHLTPIVVQLPHKVCERLAAQRETILKQSRRAGHQKAHATATAKLRESEGTAE